MLIFVINKDGEVLMPTTPRKARILLKDGKAKIVKYNPFTIQLLYGSSGYTQETRLGIDTGSKYIGIAITSGNNILAKGQINLRQDISKLLETRKILRNARRARKTRYRPAKFLNRKKKEGWLPPSIQSRVDNTIRWINKFYNLLPNCKLSIEVGKFDIQKIENPSIKEAEYQQGTLYEYRNRMAYLIARENNKCQYCHKSYEIKNNWRLHHIWGKSKDRPEDWALLHEKCHIELHQRKLEFALQKKRSKSYKESTFMNIIRKKLFTAFSTAKFTYGNITFQDRVNLGLEKTHYNDAIAISGIKQINKNPNSIFLINQFRKKKRSLHEANAVRGRKIKNIHSKRHNKNVKFLNGFYLNDKVKLLNKVGFITGFTTRKCRVKDIDGKFIYPIERTYTQVIFKLLTFINHNNNWQFINDLKEE